MPTTARERAAQRPKIVLAGGGHAHLHMLRRTADLSRRGFEVTLVNPSPYLYYSGMATGVVSGVYTPEEDRINVRRLAEAGGSFVEGRIRTVHPQDRALVLEDGRTVPYDAVSFCLGSTTPREATRNDDVLPVKPVENAAEVNRRLRHARDSDRFVKLLIVGGWAAGCEVAANALVLLERQCRGGEVPWRRGADLGWGGLLPVPAGASRRTSKDVAFVSSRTPRSCPTPPAVPGPATGGYSRTTSWCSPSASKRTAAYSGPRVFR